MLLILRYQDELRKPDSYFDSIDTKVDDSAVKLAVDLVKQESGKFDLRGTPTCGSYLAAGQSPFKEVS